jgi:FtsP/CotA-like multicopper oxidase with cupredoxin domain
MPGFRNCSTSEDRGCWLKNDETGEEYNIHTDYENHAPIGITRTYYLNVTDEEINIDGVLSPFVKLFNNSYPGPWIEACWGDTVTIIVTNLLKHNGTSIHWHGIRQLNTTHMDGVNGVTQCPIAPGDSYNYTWHTWQYGSSWYHSHYAVQYADGTVGPLTIHGPSSANYDLAIRPTLITDWGHNSAFESLYTGLRTPSILLNGTGNVTRYNNNVAAQLDIPTPYTIHFTRAKRYLLRLINTSFDSTFVFSIDNHMLQIITADFVPIYPYSNTSVLVGIGQRYHVIVEANPQPNQDGDPPEENNFWIRTWKADCFQFNQGKASPGYERAGILRYSEGSRPPKSTPWANVALRCSDETYDSLKPILPWTVGPPSNVPDGKTFGEAFTVQGKFPGATTYFPFAHFSMGGDDFHPQRISFGDPTILNLNNTEIWNPLWVVFPENYTSEDWVYMVLKGLPGNTFGAHPIHLHGHDFALLQQIEDEDFPNGLNLKVNNPPRRDVVLLPNNGYAVIAFKTDNPGPWLIHCHIALHAAWGLAMQIMERQDDARALWPSVERSHALHTVEEGCFKWNKWWGNCTNWWPGDGSTCQYGEIEASPDSGI